MHDARQPVDPLIFGTGHNNIMSRALIENASAQDLMAVPDDTGTLMRVIPLARLTRLGALIPSGGGCIFNACPRRNAFPRGRALLHKSCQGFML